MASLHSRLFHNIERVYVVTAVRDDERMTR